eukprot:7070032-Pyramimonas_sp.AAC.1
MRPSTRSDEMALGISTKSVSWRRVSVLRERTEECREERLSGWSMLWWVSFGTSAFEGGNVGRGFRADIDTESDVCMWLRRRIVVVVVGGNILLGSTANTEQLSLHNVSFT